MPIVYLTRKETFSAAHTLHNKKLSIEENRELFGKCNNCHGHNYTVEVTVRGPVFSNTGMVINISVLKQFIQDVLEQLDHRNLDELDYFKKNISTAENISIFIWQEIEQKLNRGQFECKLFEIKLFETEKNVCIFRGDF